MSSEHNPLEVRARVYTFYVECALNISASCNVQNDASQTEGTTGAAFAYGSSNLYWNVIFRDLIELSASILMSLYLYHEVQQGVIEIP
jgi:hypothetical protein